jgi:hypothetical protein
MNELEQLKQRVADLEYIVSRINRPDYINLHKITQHNGAKLGFFSKDPIKQQTGTTGIAADGTYGGDEQTMINEMHTALVNYGLLRLV